ncbi:acetyl-CoA carboxylase biotin carboxylase subunit family protein [Nocardiopsis sp. NRRL B-16309]|uniref:ATP-grasp domain-containing protein n=1 Tax=Nocardiopsis sp. NRRL B-16309 TaxID=1519494 RepID=UPI0006AE5559|nr:ATP-grasp domain-containing protein [Nocardiopsis sp. NRRL B-16309]KOX11242.1 hypothetical protein ADL05_23665 [Nocardiopsis sp. NRRL B-16309]
MSSGQEAGIIAIAHRVPVSVTPLHEWLPEVADRVVLVTSTESADGYRAVFDHVIAVDDYPDNDAVVDHLDELCRTRRVERIVCGTEDDTLRVARVRDRWNVPGMGADQALLFRDKLRMKDAVSDVVRTPGYMVPRTMESAVEFAARFGWPLVVKPRLGYGSRGVAVVRDASSLRDELAGRPADDVLVEEFVPGTVYHVDGFAHQGRVIWSVASRYLNTCLSWQDGESLGSAQLDSEDPLAQRLASFAQDVSEALSPTDTTPFHLEVFHRSGTDDLYFCETAARTGGGRILDVLEHATGMNCVREWYRAQCGLSQRAALPRWSSQRFGFLLVPPRKGTLLSLLEEQPDHVLDLSLNASPPQRFGGAAASTDTVMSLVTQGENNRRLQDNLHACADWASRAMEWETE